MTHYYFDHAGKLHQVTFNGRNVIIRRCNALGEVIGKAVTVSRELWAQLKKTFKLTAADKIHALTCEFVTSIEFETGVNFSC